MDDWGQAELTTDGHGLHDEAGEKRWRATAVQNAGANADASQMARSVLECASPLALWNGTNVSAHSKAAFRIPQGQRVALARRTKLGDDGNQMQADGNSFPVFILGWTIGAIDG